MKTGLILDSCFENHNTPPGHPERVDRIATLTRAFNAWPQREEVHLLSPVRIDPELLRLVHTGPHIGLVQSTMGIRHTALDPDTSCSENSYETALLAAGSCLELTRRVLAGDLECGFAMVRPPGHHAESSRPMGFCLFNNVAIAAAWAVQQPDVDRVAIVDFDVHHGNGTQEIFYRRDDVLYISSHQHPLYPGTGSFGEVGEEAGREFNLNYPIPAGQGNELYSDLYRYLIGPVLSRFSPDLILVSAGFDAHRADPLAGMCLDESGFRELAAILNGVAARVLKRRIVYVLEGGYDLSALAASSLAVLSECLGHPEEVSLPETGSFPDSPYLRHALRELETHAPIWADCFPER